MTAECISDTYTSYQALQSCTGYFLGPEMLTESQMIALSSQIIRCSLGPIAALGTE